MNTCRIVLVRRATYSADGRKSRWTVRKSVAVGFILVALLSLGIYTRHTFSKPTVKEKTVSNLHFDDSVSDTEKRVIREAIQKQSKTANYSGNIHVKTSLTTDKDTSLLTAYVPVTNFYSSRQMITKTELSTVDIYVPQKMDNKEREAIITLLGLDSKKLKTISTLNDVPDTAIALVPVSELSTQVKLLAFDGTYYLDSFNAGAIFRQAVFSADEASNLADIKLNDYPDKETTLKVNMTGVTALTRLMMKKLSSVKDPNYFSKQIGGFLADADITHISNEVSFKTGCEYSNTVFCAPPAMIETLKSSGVDLVELTGNHNNDSGSQYSTESINLYHSLGWNTFGGGLNTIEAAKPFLVDKKQSKVTFLGYNSADAPGSGAVAGSSTAGANSFDYAKVKPDIENAKKQSQFVIVDVQFSECFAYPAEHQEFPACDVPVGGQKDTFRKIIDLGADMVIGTQAHQPQIYEMYNGKPIYYGLGNLYFEQIQWPGTERGIILSHYFANGKLIQTKLSPTVYDESYQTHLMTDVSAVSLLQRLQSARQTARL